MTDPRLLGHVDDGWGDVADAFTENFVARGDVGAACCVYRGGRAVVDVWAGLADPATGREWQRDTLQLVFSATKGATAICANLLAQRRLLDLDAPVARYWPEFAANGKHGIRVRDVLAHRAGLAAIDGDLTLDDVLAWDPVVAALAAQPPNWEPGAAHGYHVRSYGWLVGEIVRRVTGRSLARWFAEEVAAPLDLEFWIGLPEAQEVRVAAIIAPDPPSDPEVRELMEAFLAGDSISARAMSGPSGLFAYDERWNTRELHAAEMPSSNGITSARSLARLYAATVGNVDGVRLLDAATVVDATRVRSDGPDRVIGLPMRFGTGFMLSPTLSPSSGPDAFGHAGAGGSLGLADPEAGIGFGYVMNRMIVGDVDQRADALVAAAYRCSS